MHEFRFNLNAKTEAKEILEIRERINLFLEQNNELKAPIAELRKAIIKAVAKFPIPDQEKFADYGISELLGLTVVYKSPNLETEIQGQEFLTCPKNREIAAFFPSAAEEELAKVIEVMRSAAESGKKSLRLSAHLKERLSACYENELIENPEENADEKEFQLARESALMGNANGHCHLGYCYFDGTTTDKNIPKAFNHFYAAAEHKNPAALYALGCVYLEKMKIAKDRGKKPNKEKAMQCFELAAQGGHKVAQYNHAQNLLEKGEKSKRNEALEYLSMSAEQEYKPAQDHLKDMQKTLPSKRMKPQSSDAVKKARTEEQKT